MRVLDTVALSAIALLSVTCSTGTLVNLQNKCTDAVTAYARAGGGAPTNTYNLAALTGTQQLNVGSSWTGGVVWASKNANANNSQATQLELTSDPGRNLDTYDISLVNAYNLAASIRPIGVTANGRSCGSPMCTISDLQAFCTDPDVFGSGGPYCINTDGPGRAATNSTQKWKRRCPDAYSFSLDDNTSTYTCAAGTNYNFVFCP